MAKNNVRSTTKASTSRVVGGGRSGGGGTPSKTAVFGGTGRTAKSTRSARSGYPARTVTGEAADTGGAVTGTAATNVFSRTAHGYAPGDQVRFTGITGGAGIVVGQRYYVLAAGLTANAFKVSANSGGTELDFTTDLSAGTVTRWLSSFGPTRSGGRSKSHSHAR